MAKGLAGAGLKSQFKHTVPINHYGQEVLIDLYPLNALEFHQIFERYLPEFESIVEDLKANPQLGEKDIDENLAETIYHQLVIKHESALIDLVLKFTGSSEEEDYAAAKELSIDNLLLLFNEGWSLTFKSISRNPDIKKNLMN